MHALDMTAYVAFPIALMALPFLLVNWLRYVYKLQRNRQLGPASPRPTMPVKSLLAFAVPILAFMLAAALSKSFAQDEVRTKLNVVNANCRVSISGQSVENAEPILRALRSLRWAQAHHSHPTHRIGINISDSEHELSLILARDSDDPHEYWVFFPEHSITAANEVGSIFTNVFDSY